MSVNYKRLGLDDTEAKVYLALLELGPATVSEITARAGITRTLGYHTLQKLGWHNLVEEARGKTKKIIYTVKHPRGVLQYLENKKNAWQRKAGEVERLLPELVSLYKIAQKPTVRYSPGAEGIKDSCNEAFEADSEILSVVDVNLWDTPELRSYGKLWDKERSRLKIPERELLLDTPQARNWMKFYRGSYKITQYRWIKKERLPAIGELSGNLNIFDNKVVISLLKKPNQMGIVIESSALVSVIKTLFELAWQVATPPKVKGK